MNRRQFLISSMITTGGLRCAAAPPRSRTPRPLRILVLGGTNYVGPAIVEQALTAGHTVTLFNRGITRPHLFGALEKLRGDRTRGREGLAAISDARTWDAVIDTWPADPALVAPTVRRLASRTGLYVFVSSIAVYDSFAQPGMREDAALRSDGYGGQKARAEAVIADACGGRFAVVRCPPIFGPRDPGSSLHFWLRSFARRSRVLAPNGEGSVVQLIDVRDVARWTLDSVESRRVGIYNVMTEPVSFRDFLISVHRTVGSNAEIVWVDEPFIRRERILAFSELPLWIPAGEDPGFFRISSAKARRAGLRVRSLEETLAAAWRWYRSAFFDDTVFPHNGMGISERRQDALIARWSKR